MDIAFAADTKEHACECIISYIERAIKETNDPDIPEYNGWSMLLTASLADGTVVGRCAVDMGWNVMQVELLTVDSIDQAADIRRSLMQHIEGVTLERKCSRMEVILYDWEEPQFFESIGFTVFGVLDGVPRGHTKYYMEKFLGQNNSLEGEKALEKCTSALPSGVTISVSESKRLPDEVTHWKQEYFIKRATPDVPQYSTTTYAVQATLADGTYAGGCLYSVCFNELRLVLVGVNPDLRKQGVGSAVMKMIEETAKEKGCNVLTLETYSWQARPFYERHGFQLFGTLSNCPVRHFKYYMMKCI